MNQFFFSLNFSLVFDFVLVFRCSFRSGGFPRMKWKMEVGKADAQSNVEASILSIRSTRMNGRLWGFSLNSTRGYTQTWRDWHWTPDICHRYWVDFTIRRPHCSRYSVGKCGPFKMYVLSNATSSISYGGLYRYIEHHYPTKRNIKSKIDSIHNERNQEHCKF